jgi:hypothetical protein
MPRRLGQAFAEPLRHSGIDRSAIDSLAVSSCQLAPDNGASMTRLPGISPRFLIDLPQWWRLRGDGDPAGRAGRAGRRRRDRRLPWIVARLAGAIAQQGHAFNAAFPTFGRDHADPGGAAG